jgi:elongation factor G
MPRDIHQLRNIGIIAHIDAGKTTLTERMLYYSGARHRMGEVDLGTTETDFDQEERERGITIYSACVTFKWKDVVVNLIDTPGHVDFTAEVERSLRVLDGGVVVFSAREGVEAQSETVWRQADRYHVPRLAFINKMDREGADFFGTLEQIKHRLNANPVAVQLPYGVGPPHMANPFRGVIDLVEMKLLTFDRGDEGRTVHTAEIPAEVAEDAQLWRGQMLEQLYDFSDELMVKALAEEPIPSALLRSVLRNATIANLAVPVFCGSALDKIGVQPVLDGVALYLPSPADLPPVTGTDPENPQRKVQRRADNDEPFCGLVFKIVADKHGDLSFVRVYSGQLKANSRMLNPRVNKKENVAQLWHVHASKREQVPMVECGDIVGIVGLRYSVTGDTLCDPRHPIVLESIQFPQTVISMAIEPETSDERKKLADRLEMLKRQDPTFQVRVEETGQTIVSGMGELHLEIIKNRLLRDFHLNVKVHKPSVSYRETIQRSVTVEGECHRQLAGQALFAKVRIRMEPAEQGETLMVAPQAASELPPDILAVVVEALTDQSQGGGLLGGHPLMNLRVTVLGGEYREGESNEMAFRIAAQDAFLRGLREAGCVLLEPVMKAEITTPEEYLGDIVADLQKRRAIITRTENRGHFTVVTALAPLKELFGYSGAMRSLSQGRASCTMEPSHYGPAPPEVAEAFL